MDSRLFKKHEKFPVGNLYTVKIQILVGNMIRNIYFSNFESCLRYDIILKKKTTQPKSKTNALATQKKINTINRK
jgi:hypothetical protein